jgi:hypothetical protein
MDTLWYDEGMSTTMIEQQIPDEAVAVPPLPSWLAPTALSVTVIAGFVIWMLWTTLDPTSALADPSWIFFCH